jgi:choline-sulfatase
MPDKPNLLLIMDDQHRYDYLGAAGADWVNTPNLDRLARRGVLFTHCCTNSPICAPARCSLAAGLLPHRMGCLTNQDFLPRRVTTYYQRLRDFGYRVGCVGKLDLAKADGYNGIRGDRPCTYTWGFTDPEECEGKAMAYAKDYPRGPYTYWLQQQDLLAQMHQEMVDTWNGDRPPHTPTDLPTDAFEDSYIGRRAAKWIREVNDEFPWHYFVSFVGPHNPLDAPHEFARRYADAPMPEAIADELEGKPDRIRNRARKNLTAEEVRTMRRQYCAAIELIDHQVGMILDALTETGQLDNTYILFSSDHGEMVGDHNLVAKHVAYEASLRVPLIAAGPGIEGDRVCDELVELMDVNPTLCELAGLEAQPDIDAVSFAGILRGRTDTHRDCAVSHEHPYACIRTRTHKLIDTFENALELYDLRDDPEELHNIAGDERGLCRELRGRLKERMTEGKWRR